MSCAASPETDQPVKNQQRTAEGAAYLSESPLPDGWPEPGPFNQVVRKKYPAYRAAFSTGCGINRPFGRLFGYNSPFVPRARQTHELQALLP